MRPNVLQPVGVFHNLKEMQDFYRDWSDDELAMSLIAHGCPPELLTRSIQKIREG